MNINNNTQHLRLTRSNKCIHLDNPPHGSQAKERTKHSQKKRSDSIVNEMVMEKQEQLKIKIERESTSPLNHQTIIQTSPIIQPRRTTRSTCNVITMHVHNDYPNLEPTPQDNSIHIEQEKKQPPNKILPILSSLSLPQSLPQPQKPTTPKQNPQHLPTPYSQIRKSYRKMHKKQIISIPYRKCHDALQGKIITLLNKIEQSKNCNKDLQSLIEKIQKITSKDMMNRYITSGIKTILHTAQGKNIYDINTIGKLKNHYHSLQCKIEHELDDYQDLQSPPPSINHHEYRHKIIRKIYSSIKSKSPSSSITKEQMRDALIKQCQPFFQESSNTHLLLNFIKNQLYTY